MTGELASGLKPKEYIYSKSLEEILLVFCTELSYRKSTRLLNTVLHRDSSIGFHVNTLSDHIERHGRLIHEQLHKISAEVLESHSFQPDGMPPEQSVIPESIRNPQCPGEDNTQNRMELFREEIRAFNEEKEPCDQIKNEKLINDTEISAENCVYISIDDVGVDHQKDTRKNGGTKHGKVVENTVIHIQDSVGEYVLTAIGMKEAFTFLMAFLLSNHLLENHHLYFFSDGAQNIRKNIESFFAFCPYILMLDWYHLEKKMTELLSMALKGTKKERHEIRKILDGKLWAGNTDDAICYLRQLPKQNIKNQKKLEDATAYLERKKPYIGCYALRALLNYRNSSNPVEKSNDLIVAQRQKHNGMSWSYDGSGSLASISALVYNNELPSWISDQTILFAMPTKNEELTAA